MQVARQPALVSHSVFSQSGRATQLLRSRGVRPPATKGHSADVTRYSNALALGRCATSLHVNASRVGQGTSRAYVKGLLCNGVKA